MGRSVTSLSPDLTSLELLSTPNREVKDSRLRILLAERTLGGDTLAALIAGFMAYAKIKAFKRLLSWPPSLCLEMSVRYEVRLTGSRFRFK